MKITHTQKLSKNTQLYGKRRQTAPNTPLTHQHSHSWVRRTEKRTHFRMTSFKSWVQFSNYKTLSQYHPIFLVKHHVNLTGTLLHGKLKLHLTILQLMTPVAANTTSHKLRGISTRRHTPTPTPNTSLWDKEERKQWIDDEKKYPFCASDTSSFLPSITTFKTSI